MAEATRLWNRWDSGFATILAGPVARKITRDARFTVPICIILICSSFAAAALLQMRMDRSRTLAGAQASEQQRVAMVARVAGRTLDRYARLGSVFAASPEQYRSAELGRAEPAIRDIIVWDANGRQQARLKSGTGTPPKPVFAELRTSFPGGLALREHGRTIAIWFDPKSLELGSPRTTLMPGQDVGDAALSAPVPGWPLSVATSLDEKGVLESWAHALPLYLFVILGPALAGAWLAALFVGTFERHAKAARAIRALKTTRPVEARLMVRLANAERGAMEALRSKSEFMAHMSHELRTPLNAVIGFSDIIADEMFGPCGQAKYREYARDIGEAGRNLHTKIGHILEFANIEAGRFPLAEEAVDLAALAGLCVEEQEGRAFSRRISLSLAFGEPGMVRADPQALRRILTNLIVNALTYTAEGGFVRADVRFEAGAGILTVSDSGMGFSAGEAALAGKPFQRFDRLGSVTGAGLGLAIAMELARRMGGAMRLLSGNGGAVMELRLPRL